MIGGHDFSRVLGESDAVSATETDNRAKDIAVSALGRHLGITAAPVHISVTRVVCVCVCVRVKT